VAPPRKEPRLLLLNVHLEPVTIDLDFVHPLLG
jgi:hypothetical protein